MDVKEALEQYEEVKSHNSEVYAAMREDVRFSIGLDHFTGTEETKYGKDNCISIPVLPQFIHQVANDMRQNTPSINVLPGEGEGSDPETAKIFKGLIRNIEYRSKADEVYDTGGEYAVRGGLGFARVDHDYVSSDSMLQELKLRRVQNPESVMLGPYTECDGSDAEIGFVLDKIKKKAFEETYPGKSFTSFGDKSASTDSDEIVIAEVFVKKYETIEKQINDAGEMVDYVKEDEAKEKKKKKRTLRKVKICRYKFSGSDLLEETTFPGEYIPIVPFHGEEVWVDGKRHLLSLIRQAKGAQRRLNHWAMKEKQILDMAPVAPILAPLGSVEDIPDGWKAPDDTIVLRYRMFDASGQKLDKPERLAPPPVPTGIINAMEGAKESVKETLGLYNASIGQKSNEVSGVAIDARKVEGEVATFHFADNRNRSIQQIGRILVSAIPEIYDTARVIQVLGADEKPQMVGINGATIQQGQERSYDLTRGKYDVRVTTGASYTTKRQEAAAVIGEMMKQDPEAKMMFGDLYFENLDVAGNEALAARMKKLMPPALTADETKGEVAPDPEKLQLQQALQEMQAQMQQMAAELESKQGEVAAKSAEIDLKGKELDIKAKSEEAAAENERAKLQLESDRIRNERMKVGFDAVVSGVDLSAVAMAFDPPASPERQYKEQQEAVLKAQQTDAVIQTLSQIGAQLSQLTAHVSQPKRVVRDEATGAIIGVH